MFENVDIGDKVRVKEKFWELESFHHPGYDTAMKKGEGKEFEVVNKDEFYLKLQFPNRVYMFPKEWIDFHDENYEFKQLLLKN